MAEIARLARQSLSGRFEPDTVGAVLSARRLGKSGAEAAAAGGLHLRTLKKWLARGRAGEVPYVDFARAYDAAGDVAIATRVEQARSAAERSRLDSEAILASGMQRAG